MANFISLFLLLFLLPVACIWDDEDCIFIEESVLVQADYFKRSDFRRNDESYWILKFGSGRIMKVKDMIESSFIANPTSYKIGAKYGIYWSKTNNWWIVKEIPNE